MNFILLMMILLTGCTTKTAQPLTEPIPAIDPKLIEAVIQIESSGNTLAKSSKGAIGLMQIMPSTARLLGYHPIEMWHPRTNVEAGTKLLTLLNEEYGNIHAALRAYYCGNNHNRSVCYTYAEQVMKAYKGRDYDTKSHTRRPRKNVQTSNIHQEIRRGYSFTY